MEKDDKEDNKTTDVYLSPWYDSSQNPVSAPSSDEPEITTETEPEMGPTIIAVHDARYLPEVLSLSAEATRLLEIAKTLTISDNKDLEAVTNDLSIITGIKRKMEAKRKEMLEPLKSQTDSINATFKELAAPILEADQILRNLSLEYHREVERRRREAEETNRLAEEVAQRQAAANGGEITVDLTPVEAPIEAPKTTRTDLGTSGLRDNWKYQVIDFAALPDEYKVVDTAMLNAIAKKHHDQKQVPGIRFFNEPVIAARTR